MVGTLVDEHDSLPLSGRSHVTSATVGEDEIVIKSSRSRGRKKSHRVRALSSAAATGSASKSVYFADEATKKAYHRQIAADRRTAHARAVSPCQAGLRL